MSNISYGTNPGKNTGTVDFKHSEDGHYSIGELILRHPGIGIVTVKAHQGL
ncbi:MAG: hypothetical protein ABI863_13295 [Ginsengibacter sp.]